MPRAFANARLERGHEIIAAGLKRGRGTGQQSREERREAREEDGSGIIEHPNGRASGEEQLAQNYLPDLANERARERSHQRERQALDQELRDQALARRAERESHGDLAPAAHRAAEQQIGDVGAGNEQHDRGYAG